ncbi:hypothetical protein [Bartonella rattaustraliani]|uniref:hypothetical protein n=1 Tax=Bartonella rattaustraliani TaxID=481139 RepID=UPI0012EA2581|nr:hypothetical protein [Bartonella rattaustraliani]
MSITKVLSTSHKWNHIGMFVFSLTGAFVTDYFNIGVWYIAACLMFIVFIYGGIFLPDSISERGNHESALISFVHDFKQAVSLSKNLRFISLLFIISGILFDIPARYGRLSLCNLT